MRNYLLSAAAAALALTLAACGGGGGGGDSAPQASTPLAQPKGFWNGPVTGADLGGSYARTVVLPDGRSWVFLHDGSAGAIVGLITSQLSTTPTAYTGTGMRYTASGASAGSLSLSGSAASSNSLQLNAAQPNGQQSALALAYDSRFDAPARQSDVAGDWSFTQADQTIVGTWTIDVAGRLSGSRTSGCTYAGTVTPLASVAVYEVAVTESCPGVQALSLAGIAKLNTSATVLTLGLSTSDGDQAVAFAVQR